MLAVWLCVVWEHNAILFSPTNKLINIHLLSLSALQPALFIADVALISPNGGKPIRIKKNATL